MTRAAHSVAPLRVTPRGLSMAGVGTMLTAVGAIIGSLELLAAGAVALALVIGSIGWVACGYATRNVRSARRGRPSRQGHAGKGPAVPPLRRVLPRTVRVDDPVDVVVEATGARPRRQVLLAEERTPARWVRLGIAPAPSGRGTTDVPTASYTIVLDRRGEHAIGPAVVRTGDPFGIATSLVHVLPPSMVVALPASITLPRLIEPNVAGTTASRSKRRNIDVSDERGDLRAYVPGDDLRHVHWRTSARLDTLVVTPPAPSLDADRPRLLVDLRSAVHTPASIEVAIRVATALLLDGGRGTPAAPRRDSSAFSVDILDDAGVVRPRGPEDALVALACHGSSHRRASAPQRSDDASPVTFVVTAAGAPDAPHARGADRAVTLLCDDHGVRLLGSSLSEPKRVPAATLAEGSAARDAPRPVRDLTPS